MISTEFPCIGIPRRLPGPPGFLSEGKKKPLKAYGARVCLGPRMARKPWAALIIDSSGPLICFISNPLSSHSLSCYSHSFPPLSSPMYYLYCWCSLTVYVRTSQGTLGGWLIRYLHTKIEPLEKGTYRGDMLVFKLRLF